MKLIKIAHYRCDSTDAYSYVWAPDDWDEDQTSEAIDRAVGAYIKFLREFKDVPAPNDYRPYGQPPYADYPDKTVAEVDTEWAVKKIEHDEWQAERTKAKKPFRDYLYAEGFKTFWEAEEDGCFDEYTAYWGHNHGLGIEYGDKDPNKDDVGPVAPDLDKPRARKARVVRVK